MHLFTTVFSFIFIVRQIDNCATSTNYSAIILSRSTATVVVAFVAVTELSILLEELSLEPSPPRQWIGSESWVTNHDMLRFSFCAGAVGFGIQKSVIPGLREFLLDLSPSNVAASPVLTEFWEDAFNCKLGKSEKVDVLAFNCHGHCFQKNDHASLTSSIIVLIRWKSSAIEHKHEV